MLFVRVVAGWKSEDEIVAYQLCVKLRDEIIELTEAGAITRSYKLRNQIRDSAASAASNISEGFHRFNHGEFAYLAGVAKASLAETRDHLADGLKRRYFSDGDVKRLDHLADQAIRATAGLIRHLRSTPTPRQDPREESASPNSKRKGRRPKRPH